MKTIVLSSLIILFSISSSFSQEFGVGGVRRGGTSPNFKQKMKEKLKADLKLTDDQAGTATVVQQNYEFKMRAIKIDTKLSDEERSSKLKALEEERRQNLKATLSDEQIDKLDAISLEVRKARGQRQGARTTTEN